MMARGHDLDQCRSIQTDLKARSLAELDGLFAAGRVPHFADISGPTSGAWLAKPPDDYWWARVFIRIFLASPWARWTGKGFVEPFDDTRRGRGANLFANRIGPRRYPFATYVKQAEVDESNCLTLEYPRFSIMYGLIDDVRQIDDGVLLGQMHFRFPWQRARTFIGYFVLCAIRAEAAPGP